MDDHQTCEIEFEPVQWFLCNHALRITNLTDPLFAAPEAQGDWPSLGCGGAARKSREEVLETILILNLRELLRERLNFLFRGGDYWGIQDVTAVDSLGRFHLFELKRDRVRGVVAEQLGVYLLSGLFQSGDHFLEEQWSMNVERLSAKCWALYLAAAQANERTSSLGKNDVSSWHPSVLSGDEPRFGKSRWQKLYTAGESDTWLIEAMIAKAKARGAQGVTIEMISSWGESTYHQMTATKPSRPKVRPKSQAVIWLVGRGFDREAFEQVRLWRRSGLDARCLFADARQSNRTGQWVICVRREAFPQRGQALDEIAKVQGEIESNTEACRLDLELYESKPPSDTNIQSGGWPLRDATRMVVRGWNDSEKVLYPAPRIEKRA